MAKEGDEVRGTVELRSKRRIGWLGWLMLVVLLLAIGAAVFFWWQWRGAEKEVMNGSGDALTAEDAVQEEIDRVIGELSSVVALPEGETPTLVKVTNLDELTENREFFAEAQNGDVVLVYNQARRAYLFRPAENKLINLAPITIDEAGNTSQNEGEISENDEEVGEEVDSEESATTNQATVVLYNGTSQVGLTFDFEPLLKDSFPDVEVSDKDNAGKKNYTASLMVVIEEDKSDLAEKIAEKLQLEVKKLPSGEKTPDAELLIILGSDRIVATSPTAES